VPIAEIMLFGAMALQFAAVCLVFRFLFYSYQRAAWLFIATALIMMAAQSFVTLYKLVVADVPDPSNWVYSLISLSIFGFMFGGILIVGPAVRLRYDQQKKIDASMAIMENLLAHSPSSIAVRDLDGTYLLVNNSYARAYGKPREEIIGKRTEDVLEPEFAKAVKQYDAVVLTTSKPLIHEHMARFADGDGMLLTVRFPVRDSNEDIIGVGGIGTDVTETHRVRQSLEIQQDRYERATQAAKVGVWEWNLLTGDIYIAPNLEEMYGCAPDEHITHIDQWFALLDPKHVKTVEEKVAQYLAGERHNEDVSTYSIRTRDGQERWYETRSLPLIEENGKVMRLIGTDTEITLRHKTAQHAREREALLNSILENLPVGILIKDRDLRYQSANRTFLEWYGVTMDELSGKTFSESTGFQEDSDSTQVELQEREVLATGDIIERMSARNFADGKQHVVRITKFPIHDENGDITKIGSVSVDLTEQTRAQEELEAANKRLDAANRAKSEFLAHMSHELRTPLNSVIGFSEMVRTETLGPIDNLTYIDYAGYIQKSASHLLNVINDILDISKIEAGELEMDEVAVDLHTLVAEAMTLASERAVGKDLAVESNIPTDLPKLMADERMIKQVIVNLLSNAVKFTPDGGSVTVTAACDPDRQILLSVRDNGIGIAEKDIPRAMQPFEQVRRSASLSHSGTGLGLSLSKKLLELHGADLFINSEVGVGTTVTIILPASRTVR
jgi:PAS domain S-box-containing protein